MQEPFLQYFGYKTEISDNDNHTPIMSMIYKRVFDFHSEIFE